MTEYRNGVLQVPVFREGFVPYTGKRHRAIGIRCPRCQIREIVYNGNYFCADEEGHCGWALPHGDPHPEFSQYDEPEPLWDLVDAIVKVGCAGGREGSAW